MSPPALAAGMVRAQDDAIHEARRLVGEPTMPLVLTKLAYETFARVPGDHFTIKLARGRVLRCRMDDDGWIELDRGRARPRERR